VGEDSSRLPRPSVQAFQLPPDLVQIETSRERVELQARTTAPEEMRQRRSRAVSPGAPAQESEPLEQIETRRETSASE
jgi:hypothetical protein